MPTHVQMALNLKQYGRVPRKKAHIQFLTGQKQAITMQSYNKESSPGDKAGVLAWKNRIGV